MFYRQQEGLGCVYFRNSKTNCGQMSSIEILPFSKTFSQIPASFLSRFCSNSHSQFLGNLTKKQKCMKKLSVLSFQCKRQKLPAGSRQIFGLENIRKTSQISHDDIYLLLCNTLYLFYRNILCSCDNINIHFLISFCCLYYPFYQNF